MRKIRVHRHVVAFHGLCQDPICIVTGILPFVYSHPQEFCSLGSLVDLLRSQMPMDMDLKIQIIKGVASGMVHLQQENVIHRDLAARNVLLSEGYVAKVSGNYILIKINYLLF